MLVLMMDFFLVDIKQVFVEIQIYLKFDYWQDQNNLSYLQVLHQKYLVSHKLVLFLLLGVGKILIMLRHNSGFPALIRRKITLSMGFIT